MGEPAALEGAGRTVLMVENDADVRTSVSRGLRHSGFDVRVAATGKEALRLLAHESHDALWFWTFRCPNWTAWQW